MKLTQVIYLRRDNQQMTEKEVIDSIYIHSELSDEMTPKNWTVLKTVEIVIPDSLIDDIISANTDGDIDKKINLHKAEIIKLEEFRNKGK